MRVRKIEKAGEIRRVKGTEINEVYSNHGCAENHIEYRAQDNTEYRTECCTEHKKPDLIQLLFDIVINKKNSGRKTGTGNSDKNKSNKNSSNDKIAARLADGNIGKRKGEKKEASKEESIEERLGLRGIREKELTLKGAEEQDKDAKHGFSFPKLFYFNMNNIPKVDYGALFSYLGSTFKAFYDEYKAFKYDGEGRVEFESAVKQRKYERIIEKEMMVEYNFFAMEHTNPEEKEAYSWDKTFGFRKAIIYLQYFMKPGSLRVIPGLMHYSENTSNESKAA